VGGEGTRPTEPTSSSWRVWRLGADGSRQSTWVSHCRGATRAKSYVWPTSS
jgi:hypothetical protein